MIGTPFGCPNWQFTIFAIQPFIIDEQPEELRFAQVLMVAPLEALFECSREAEEFHGDQLLVGLFIQRVDLRLDD